ncbi:PQQ-dependent sugar dehydrogenase [Opitutia bacterium ISCC 51]|nr:PQQ-dependent sugar dehydrogenase [Opitutae bacterium ISCC 51]QXD26436.1 PQQ-dependent sugar dehydrogenase [Opitutae bacterium ISCC 52]
MPRILFLLFPLLTIQAWSNEREPWTNSNIQGSPEPPLPYQTEEIWPHIEFEDALDITLLRSEEKLFISEQKGKLWILPADLNAQPERAIPAGDLSELAPHLANLYGLVFHPDFQENRELYFYFQIRRPGEENNIRISRFKMNDQLQLVPGSKENLLEFPGSGHNGGDMHFGPDGMLYFTVGDLDAPSPPDKYNVGQDLSNLASTVGRIDVDSKDPDLPYAIPKDNPFVDTAGARPEIWAYGFRNPWKMCFRPGTNEIWLGDVGWEMWEMVYRVKKGGNYGWSIMEGPVPLKPNQKQGPTPIIPPVTYYGHTVGASITGGYFLNSSRLPDLQGAYIYGDYNSGKVWALKWDGKQVSSNRLIADTRKRIVSFGQDINGDLLFIDHPDKGQLYRLIANEGTKQVSNFPTRLSNTGLFKDVKSELPSTGVYPFSITSPTWQDGNDSSYWVGIPGKGRMEAAIAYRDELPLLRLKKPNNTVLAKTIHKNGKRIETQLLHFDGFWNGYSYQWNEEQTDAKLVHKEGLDTVIDGSRYRFPSRDECLRCHGSNFYSLQAFLPSQLDKGDQLNQLLELGLIDKEFKTMAHMENLADPYDEDAPIDQRARSWIHSNCSYCHRTSGGAGVTSMFNAAVPTDRMRLVSTSPEKGTLGLDEGFLIDPGNPYNSIFYYRIATKGAGHMPMIGPKTMDKAGIQLVHDWIRSMDPEKEIPKPSKNPQSVGEALALYNAIQSGELNKADAEQAIANCMKSSLPFVINLFAGFTLD